MTEHVHQFRYDLNYCWAECACGLRLTDEDLFQGSRTVAECEHLITLDPYADFCFCIWCGHEPGPGEAA